MNSRYVFHSTTPLCISFYDPPFSSHKQLCEKRAELPQSGFGCYKIKGILCTWFWFHGVPNFNHFRSTPGRFQVTRHFETTRQYDHRIILNPTRQKEPHIRPRTTRPSITNGSKISTLIGCLEMSTRNDPKMISNTRRSKLPYNLFYCRPRLLNFTEFSATCSCPRVKGHFRTILIQKDLEYYKVKCIPYISRKFSFLTCSILPENVYIPFISHSR